MVSAIKISDLEKAALRDRRERIATAALQGLLACPNNEGKFEAYAKDAVAQADALIAELDKPKEEQT